MRSKLFTRVMKFLILAAGAGAGVGLAFLYVQVHDLTTDAPMALEVLICLYVGTGLIGGLCGYLAIPRLMKWGRACLSSLENRLDALSPAQLFSMATWLIGSLLVAALINQVLRFLGEGIFTMAISAICYVVLAVIGITIGARRADDMMDLLVEGRRGRRAKQSTALLVLDAACLMDGRIAALRRTGLLSGTCLTTDQVQQELEEALRGPDAVKKLRAQRGLDTLRLLQSGDAPLQLITTSGPPAECDVALMSLAREKGATLITADPTMHKAARVAGVPVINLNDVALALRTAVAAGDEVALRIAKEGREAGQGVGYLDDGTMVVVEHTAHRMGETLSCVVTSVLQTSAGRMAFAKLKE